MEDLKEKSTTEMEDEITIKREVITPERASVMLANNTFNRPLHYSAVRIYAEEMKKGRWRENVGQPIIFASDGTLLDGQHRLQAIIKAGIPIKMGILRGANKSDFVVLDTGVKRTGADVLNLSGIPNDRNLCAAIRAYWSFRKEYTPGKNPRSTMNMGYTNEDVLNEYNSSPDFYQAIVHKAYSIYKQCRYLPASEIAGLFIFLVKERHYDVEKVRGFFDELLMGGEYKALAWLRLRFGRSLAPKYEKDRLTPNEKRILIARAWNIFIREDKEVTRVYCRLGDRPIFD